MATASRDVGRRNMKEVWNCDRADVMSSCKNLSQMGLVKYYTLYGCVCGTCVADSDTFVSSEDYLGVFGKGNPPCNVEDNLRVGHLVIEACSGATVGVATS